MEKKIVNFFTKNKIQPTDILYLHRESRHTLVKLKDGRSLRATVPVKYFLAPLPDGEYLHITKGVIVCASGIVSIEGNVYTMSDGVQFTGRVRTAGTHKQNKKRLENHTLQSNQLIAQTVFQQFSIMDRLPLPLSVIELVLDEDKHTIDFIVRYCNEAMAKYQGCFREELLDRSFNKLTESRFREWTLLYTEVAMLGTSQAIDWVHPVTGNPHTIHLFQPAKGLCGCLIMETEK